jgi:hypothetical protein
MIRSNISVQAFTRMTLFYTIYSKHSCLLYNIKNDILKGEIAAVTSNTAAEQQVEWMKKIHKKLEKNLKAATESQVKYYNAKHILKNFTIEDKILLSIKNLQIQHPSWKLNQH